MLITIRLAILSLLLVLANPSETYPHGAQNGDIEVIHPWAKPSWNKRSQAYAIVSNEGQTSIDLLRIEAPNNLQFTFIESGKVVPKITIQAEDIIDFNGEVYAIEMSGLREPLKIGGQFQTMFYFSGGVTVSVIIVVGENTMIKGMEMAE